MKLHVESAACRTRAHCVACQDPGAEGVTFRLTRRSAGYTDLPANGAVLPCPWGQKPPPAVTADSGGPGTELKRMLATMGITAGSACACNRHAVQMNQWGPDECLREGRMSEILAWLAEEAESRHLPFFRPGAELMVRAAIRRARRKEGAGGR